ncbi:MAG: hypothetical protein K2J85_08060 [Anaeroplasmataceae bacterium]|nr:hypothetical protein [Anaeroplasmataceae bacterium]
MKIRLKMSKTILFFAMLFCMMITFGFISMNASAMECNEDNLVEPSQNEDEHTHNYTYIPKSGKHLRICSCGERELAIHKIASADCNKDYANCKYCGARLNLKTDLFYIEFGPDSTALSTQSNEADLEAYSQDANDHTHSYSYKRISYKNHQLKCECGAVTGEERPHIINSSDTGKRYAECMECHDVLDMTTDMAIVGFEPEEPHTHEYTYTPVNNNKHTGYCDCGATVTGNHKFTQVPEGQKCIQCGHVVKFLIGISSNMDDNHLN